MLEGEDVFAVPQVEESRSEVNAEEHISSQANERGQGNEEKNPHSRKKAVQPLLLRFNIGYFGMSVGLSAQAALWHTLSFTPTLVKYNIPAGISETFWWLALVCLLSSACLYICKIAKWRYGVLRELLHPLRVNFFFMPSIVVTFLLMSAPQVIRSAGAIRGLFFVVFTVDFLMRVFLWGEWLVSESMGLSQFYTPAMVTVVNCFFLAKLAASPDVDQPDLAAGAVAVGLVFYLTVFVRAFGRPLNKSLPPPLLPALFFFLAPPFSIASVWMELPISAGSKGLESSFGVVFFYFGLFMYVLLLRFIHSFFILRFSMIWWAYTFPPVAAAIATVEWAGESKARIGFAFFLTAVSTVLVLMILLIMAVKVIHAKSLAGIFPDDELMSFLLDQQRIAMYKRAKQGLVRKAYEERRAACEWDTREEWQPMSIADRYQQHCPWRFVEEDVVCSESTKVE